MRMFLAIPLTAAATLAVFSGCDATHISGPTSQIAPGPIHDITFDDLAFEQPKDVPYRREWLGSEIEALFGKRVRLRGYMLPSFRQRGIKHFILVRDNMECCFGPGAALCDSVAVEMLPPATAQFQVRPITVEGILEYEELQGPSGPACIFRLGAESAR